MKTTSGRTFVVLLAGLLAGGCTMVHSVAVDPGREDQVGDYVYRLPKTMVRIRAPEAQKHLLNVEIRTRTVRDPSQEYLIDYEPSVLSNDQLKIDRAQGDWAMGSVNGTADDQTHTVLKNLGKSVGRIQGQGLNQFLSGSRAPNPLWFEFDPHDPRSLAAARAVLGMNEAMALDVKCIDCGPPSARLRGGVDGIPTRTKSLRHLLICENSCDSKSKRRLFTFQSFNDSSVVALKVARSLFVKRETTITFHEGEVAKVEIKKPSEAAQAAALPGEIVASVAAGLTEGFQSQGVVVGARGTAIDKQIELQGKQIQLMQKELELERARIQTESCRRALAAERPLPAECTTGSSTPPPPAQPNPPQVTPPATPNPAPPAANPSPGPQAPGATGDSLPSDPEADQAEDETDAESETDGS